MNYSRRYHCLVTKLTLSQVRIFFVYKLDILPGYICNPLRLLINCMYKCLLQLYLYLTDFLILFYVTFQCMNMPRHFLSVPWLISFTWLTLDCSFSPFHSSLKLFQLINSVMVAISTGEPEVIGTRV